MLYSRLRPWHRCSGLLPCSIPGCDRGIVARGYCRGHYGRWKTHGDVRADVPLQSAGRLPCSVCGAAGVRDGLCNAHLQRRIRRGSEHAPHRVTLRTVTKSGYVRLMAPDHPMADRTGRVMEHRAVMYEMLGRELLEGETVHHKNGIRHDNRPENLELWVTSQPAGQRVEDVVAHAREMLGRYADLVAA